MKPKWKGKKERGSATKRWKETEWHKDKVRRKTEWYKNKIREKTEWEKTK